MGLSAVCRWVDTQLEPPNRRYCLGFWGVHNRTRQTRFVSEFVELAALNHDMRDKNNNNKNNIIIILMVGKHSACSVYCTVSYFSTVQYSTESRYEV